MTYPARVNPDFRKWACSLSGCDGGDPHAPIWLSGIEYGYAKSRGQSKEDYEAAITDYYVNELPREMALGPHEPKGSFNWHDYMTGQFNLPTTKLFTAIHGNSVESYARIYEEVDDVRFFKLNLYPVAFRYADSYLWDKYKIAESTGLENKDAYRTWCLVNRFPVVAQKVTDYNPELIIGVGIGYLADFFVCFAGAGGSENVRIGLIAPEGSVEKNQRRFYWSRINNGKTVLAVIPFYSSASGLNSNALLQELGRQLSKLRAGDDI